MQFATKEAADEFDRGLKVLRRAIAMAANKPRARTTEELGVENMAPAPREVSRTAMQQIQMAAAERAPEALQEIQNRALAKQLADAAAMTPYSVQLKLPPEKLAAIKEWKDVVGDANRASEAIKRQVAGEDQVNQPNHYTSGGIEVIDYLRAKLTKEQLKGYYVGNLLKYLSRADHKGGVEDYKKAQVYLRWLIELEDYPVTYTED